MKPYIKDLQSGNIRPYGSNHHDSLLISQDGTYLTYEHLQCGDGSIAGDKENSGFVFCDDKGHTPEEDEILCRYGADAYFNIGGWEEPPKWIPISERLPEDLEPVNITWVNHEPASYYNDIKDKPFTATGVYFNGQWYWWSTLCIDTLAEYSNNYDDIIDETIEITAWMPLPEPDKAESEDKTK